MSKVMKVHCGIYEDMELPELVNPVNTWMNISEFVCSCMSMNLPELGEEGLIIPPWSVKPLP